MFKEEIKNELKNIFGSNKKNDDEITNIKIAIHNLEKLGFNTAELEKALDNVNIEFYKFKVKNADFRNDFFKS